MQVDYYMDKSWIDNLVFGGIVFLLLGIPLIRLMIMVVKYWKEDKCNLLNEITNNLMKLFNSLLIRKTKDAELCFLRDLITISVTKYGMSQQAYGVIKEIMQKEKIAASKYEQALNTSPDCIADVYPTDRKHRQEYLFYLVYVMLKGNSNSYKKRDYVNVVAKKLGFTQKDILQTMEAVKVLLLRSSSSKVNQESQWQVKSTRHFTKEELDLVEKAMVVESEYGNSCCFFMKNGTQIYVPMSKDSKSKVGDYINLYETEIVTLSKDGKKDIQRIKG